jgi:hypothetical protein
MGYVPVTVHYAHTICLLREQVVSPRSLGDINDIAFEPLMFGVRIGD